MSGRHGSWLLCSDVASWPGSSCDCTVTGADGWPKVRWLRSPLATGVRVKSIITHSFLYRQECPVPLLGRESLNKLGTSILLGQSEVQEDREFKQNASLGSPR